MSSNTSVIKKLTRAFIPVGLVFTIQQQNAVEAARVNTAVNTEAHIQEIASLVQAALVESGEDATNTADLGSLSNSEINSQIHSTIEEAIKSQNKHKANSKLGFLQKVVSLDCFFGGSDCLFKDKKSMMAGKVTEFAKKRFEEGNKDVATYLAQVKAQVAQDLQKKSAAATEKKTHSTQKTSVNAKNLVNNKQTTQQQKLESQLHESVAGLLKLNKQSDSTRPAPTGKNVLLATKATDAANTDKRSQLVQVPIDEVAAIGIKASPTYDLDDIQSVTLKAFRKVIGYDTFDSILKKDRHETKDPADYYNVTVSMMIKRNPKETKTFDPATIEGKPLNKALDKGFPYDDSDIDVSERAHHAAFAHQTVAQVVGTLNGQNVTKESLKNLITDRTTPVTTTAAPAAPAKTTLAQISKSDADGLFKLMDANVTRGNLKNLVTDKPAPITVALAQKSDADGLFKLMDANVTRGNLKNLVTDKPAPITVALAQKSDADGLFKLMDANVTRGNLKNLVTDKPAPITVALAQKSDADGLFKLMDANVTRGNLKNLVTDKPAPITVALAQKSDADGLFKLMDANVTRGNLKNLVTDKPAPITVALAQKSDADGLFKLMDANVTRGNLKNLVTDKPAPITVALAQKSDADGLFKLMDANVTRGNLKNLVTDKPAPITVALAQKSDADGLFKLMDANVTRGNLKNLVTDKPAPITVALAQKSDADGLFKLMDANVTRGNLKNLVTDKPAPITVALAQVETANPVVNPPFNNWSVNQPSPPHEHGMRGNEDLGQREIIIDGVNYDFVQTNAQNPVVNPPFNNWSVNQPSVPHDVGLAGKADLGQNIIVDGHAVHFNQKSAPGAPVQLAQIMPFSDKENQPGNLLVKERDPSHNVLDLAQVSSSAQH